MKDFPVRSPRSKVGGIVYFGRMLDKIRAEAKGELPPEYQPNLGTGFDGECVEFLQINYDELVEQVKQGGTDDQILEWCFVKGRRPTANNLRIWNEFMQKRGWNDELAERLTFRKAEIGVADRTDIRTMFDFIDADEGRFPAVNI
jgi:hypothetical protein